MQVERRNDAGTGTGNDMTISGYAGASMPSSGPALGSAAGSAAAATLPVTDAGDYASGNPTPLDGPDATYPTLLTAHVAVLRAIGTPEALIQQIASSGVSGEYMDRYIQGEIMQNPEGWDAMTGSPQGTARAGLQSLMPGIALPQPGAGHPGYLDDGTPVSGVTVPGASSTMLDPTTGKPTGGGMMTAVLGAAAVVGVGLVAWKMKSGRAAAEAARDATHGAQGVASGLASKLAGLRDVLPGGVAQAVEGGGAGGAASEIADAGGDLLLATGTQFVGSHAPNGFITSAGLAAREFDMPMSRAIDAALADRWLSVMESAAHNGHLGDFVAAHAATRGMLGETVEGAGSASASVRDLLRTMADSVPG